MSGSLTAGLEAVWASSTTDVFAVGRAIYHYDGYVWSAMDTGTLTSASDVWGSAPDNVFVVGVDGIHRYDGSTWSQEPTGMPTEPTLYAIWGSSINDIFAVGEAGVILRYDGSLWSQMAAGVSDPFYGVGGSSSNNVFAVGYMGLLYHFDGVTWSPMVSGTTQPLYDVWASSPTDVFAIGGVTLRYDGTVWTVMDLPGGPGVWGSSPTNVYATYGGSVMHYDGTSWTESEPWFGQSLKGLFGLSDCDVFAVGGGGAIVRYKEMAPVPVLISHFGASAREKAIDLTWQIASEEPVVGFRIYRSDEGAPIERTLNESGLVVPTAQRYTDTTVQPGMRYGYTVGVIAADGSEVRSQTIEIQSTVCPLVLFQNHPNPFNPTTRIRFSVPQRSRVALRIFDAEGKLITVLINRVMDPGLQEIEWNGRHRSGHSAASGVYFYQLKGGNRTLTKKMVLLK